MQDGSGTGGNMILEWDTNFATTVNQIKSKQRKAGLNISISKDGIVKQYVLFDATSSRYSQRLSWAEVVLQLGNILAAPFIPTKNLLENIDWIRGYRLDANAVEQQDNNAAIAYLMIPAGKSLSLTATANSSYFIIGRNINNSYIHRQSVGNITLSAQDDAYILGITVVASDIDSNSVQLEYGDASEIQAPGETVQEYLKKNTPLYVPDTENKANLPIVELTMNADTHALSNNGYAFSPFSVNEGDTVNVLGTKSDTNLAGLCFFSYSGDLSDINSFISGATYISGPFKGNGNFTVPSGANCAVYFSLLNNKAVKINKTRYPYISILVNKLYDGFKNEKSLADEDLRKTLSSTVDFTRNSNPNFSLAYYCKDKTVSSKNVVFPSNGFYYFSGDQYFYNLFSEASEQLKKYGCINTIKWTSETEFEIANDKSRVITFAGVPIAKKQIKISNILANYDDYIYVLGFIVKYAGEESDLDAIRIGELSYNTIKSDNTQKVNRIKLEDGVYFVSVFIRIRIRSDGSPDIINYVSSVCNYKGAQILLPAIDLELSGLFQWHPKTDAEESLVLQRENDTKSYNNFRPKIIGENELKAQILPLIKSNAIDNEFEGANVVWLGTSVPNEPPFGESMTRKYPEFVADLLRCNVTVRSIGGTKMTYNPDENVYGLSMTEAEYEEHQSAAGIERSYETQLDGCWDSDLFVFDHLHNDNGLLTTLKDNPDYWDSDLRTFKITEANKFDRTWAVGAFNYVIAEIFRYNPRAKIAIINDWRAEPFYNKLANRVVADLWGIPICELRMCNGNVDITTMKDTYLERYNGGANIKLLAGSSANPLYFQTKSAPDETASVVEVEESITYEKGPDSIHPGRYGRIMYAKHVAAWMKNNILLDKDLLAFIR